MKYSTVKLLIIFGAIPFLFFSCAKSDEQIIETEIVLQVPVYKDDGSSDVSDVLVFPNPFWDEVNIGSYLPVGEYAEIQLSDAEGKFSFKSIITDKRVIFETEDFPEGIYYIEIKKDGYVDRAKMIKQNWR